jgi:hypothetical protein
MMALSFTTDIVGTECDDVTVDPLLDPPTTRPTTPCEPELSLVRANASLLIWLYP